MKTRYLLYTSLAFILIGCGGASGTSSGNEEKTAGINFTDSDGDGFPDHVDKLPYDPSEWLDHDNDGIGNNADLDDDGDGIPDTEDLFPLHNHTDEVLPSDMTTSNSDLAEVDELDTDADGMPDVMDLYPEDHTKISEQGMKWERWNSVFGSADSVIESNIFKTETVDTQFFTGNASTPTGAGDQFIQRIRGYIFSESDQNVEFYLAGDDHYRLYLSPSIFPHEKQMIVDSTEWVEPLNFTTFPQQKSSKIALQAGKFYYFEAFSIEYFGNDHLSIAWSKNGGAIEAIDSIQQFKFPSGFNEKLLDDMDLAMKLMSDLGKEASIGLDVEPITSAEEDMPNENTDKDNPNDSPEDPMDRFENNKEFTSLVNEINESVIQTKCIACHKENGFAGDSKLVFETSLSSDVATLNVSQISMLMETSGAEYVLSQVRGENHRGGAQYASTTPQYALLETLWSSINTDNETKNEENNNDSEENDSQDTITSNKDLENIGLNKASKMSSTAFGGNAEKAVDGNVSGSNWVHSNGKSISGKLEWWSVDLGEKMYIDHFIIHPRPSFNSRIEGGYIVITSEDTGDKQLDEIKNDFISVIIDIPTITNETKIIASNVGRYVKVFGPDNGDYLNFTEVQMMGHQWEEIERETPEIQYSQLGQRCDESQSLPPMVRRLTKSELISTVNSAFPSLLDKWNPETLSSDLTTEIGFDNDLDLVNGSITFVDEWSRTSEKLADYLLSKHQSSEIPCLDQGESCVNQLLPDLLEKLARKPLSTKDESELIEYWRSVNDLMGEEAAWKWTLSASLQHPAVIYRSEVGEKDNGSYTLSGREIADAISYTYTSKPADNILIGLADSGELYDPSVRVEQAKRLLKTKAGEDTVLRFFKIWLKLDKVKENTKIEVNNFSQLAEQMTQEALMTIKKVIIDENGSVGDLLTSQTTFINQNLSDHYGWNASPGEKWVEVQRENGLGYLTSGAFLIGNSLPQMSSPTQRGMLIYRRMLCNDVPPAPPEIPSIDVEVTESLTTRERWIKEHTGDPACQACHENFDPIGFAFENFDDLGRYRTTEHGKFVDATGMITGDYPVSINGPEQLVNALAEDERLANCVSGFMNHWVFAGATGKTCLAESPREQLANGQLTFLEYFAAIAGEINFVQRQAD